jgi:hypothetical protein
MRIVRHTIWIARSPEDVFEFFIDLSQGHLWRQYVTSMSLASDPPLRAGSLVLVTLDLLGKPYPFDLEVLAFERPTRWRHRTNESDFAGYIEYRFDADNGGNARDDDDGGDAGGPVRLARDAADVPAAREAVRRATAAAEAGAGGRIGPGHRGRRDTVWSPSSVNTYVSTYSTKFGPPPFGYTAYSSVMPSWRAVIVEETAGVGAQRPDLALADVREDLHVRARRTPSANPGSRRT